MSEDNKSKKVDIKLINGGIVHDGKERKEGDVLKGVDAAYAKQLINRGKATDDLKEKTATEKKS